MSVHVCVCMAYPLILNDLVKKGKPAAESECMGPARKRNQSQHSLSQLVQHACVSELALTCMSYT